MTAVSLVTVVVVDALAAVLLLRAGWAGVRFVLGDDPSSPGLSKTALARRLEDRSKAARSATILMVAGALLVLVGITLLLPPRIPGAICGAGVFEATGGALWRALVLRLLAIATMLAWWFLDRLDAHTSESPLAKTRARLLLVATPLALMAGWESASALLSIEGDQPVSCCAAIYGNAWSSGSTDVAPEGGHLALVLFIVGGALLVVAGLSSRLVVRRPWLAGLVLAALAGWWPVAAHALSGPLAGLHFEGSANPCGWCLFQPEHFGVGYLLFGCLGVATAAGGAMAIGAAVARRAPLLAELALARARRAGLVMAAAVVGFCAMALFGS